MTFDLRAYWPQPAAGKQLLAQFAYVSGGTERMSVLKRYVQRGTVGGQAVIRMDEYAPGWVDAWEYCELGNCIEEVGTWQAGSHKVYKANKTIPWGGVQSVNDVIERQLEVDVALSSGVDPGHWNYGYQKITFQDFLSSLTTAGGDTFADVARIKITQTWCNSAACDYPASQVVTQMKYWLAPGLGAVQIEYILPIARVDYATFMESWETP